MNEGPIGDERSPRLDDRRRVYEWRVRIGSAYLRARAASGWLVVMILAVTASPARAQSLGAGAIEGAVTDESHAAMPGVTVSAAAQHFRWVRLRSCLGRWRLSPPVLAGGRV